jgi:simple sugar transport system permease protein
MMRSGLLVGTAALAIGLGVLALGLQLSGYAAAPALGALLRGAFGSWYAITSATLVRAVPLIVIGLGIAIAFRAKAFNIGAEGQFYAGAIAATWAGLHVGGWPRAAAIPAVWLAAAAAGGVWIALPIWLKRRFGVLEVISTLLLNFVAESLVSWMVQGPLQEARRVYPQSDPIIEAARLPVLPGTRLHLGFLLALGAAVVVHYVFRRTVWGFDLLATGSGPNAARVSGGIDVRRVVGLALLWSGLFAGLAGGVEVSGVSYALFQNLSPGYGFSGIAVALLARLQPLAIVLTGLLFGALEAGAAAMQRDAGVPAVAVYVVEGVVILVLLLADSVARRVRSAVVLPDAEAETA